MKEILHRPSSMQPSDHYISFERPNTAFRELFSKIFYLRQTKLVNSN